MSINSKKLDRALKKGGPIALAICAVVPKSMRHAHRNGAVPTLQWMLFYHDTFALYGVAMVWREWLSGADMTRHKKRLKSVSLPPRVPDAVYDQAREP